MIIGDIGIFFGAGALAPHSYVMMNHKGEAKGGLAIEGMATRSSNGIKVLMLSRVPREYPFPVVGLPSMSP